MRATKLYLCVGAVLACAAGEARAEIFGTFWEVEAPNVYNLYAAMEVTTTVFNADLGDITIDLPPDGLNTGLYSSMGEIVFAESSLTIGGVAPSFARPFTVTPSGTGSLADASWFVIGGVLAQFYPNVYSDYAFQLGHFVVEDGAWLGGPFGGPNGDIQSRIFIGWQDQRGQVGGVYNIPRIPTPASLALLALGLIPNSRRRAR